MNARMNDRMNEATVAIENRGNQIARLQASTGPLLEAIGGVAIGLITLYTGMRTLNGTALPGEFVSFSAAMLLAYEPAKRLARLRVNLETSAAGVRLLYSIFDTAPSNTEIQAGPPLQYREGRIGIRHAH